MEAGPAVSYRVSSFCGGGNCVEVAPLPNGDVHVRDTKNRSLAAHVFTAQEWADFIQGAKEGEFDFSR